MILLKYLNRGIRLVVIVFLLFSTTSLQSFGQSQYQNATPPSQVDNEIVEDEDADEMTPPDDIDPLNVPFDGGASILLASGLAYGAKKYRERKKVYKSEESESK
jgi:hypothetical protein